MAKKKKTKPGIATLLNGRPDLYAPGGEPLESEEIAELEETLGRGLPDAIVTLLRMSNGGVVHGPQEDLHLASAEQFMVWHNDGVMEDLEAIPFGHNGSDCIFLLDTEGAWGAPAGGIYCLRTGRRTLGGYPLQDVVRLVDSVQEFFEYLAAGKEPW